VKVPGEVFREYDIRGIVGDALDPDLTHAVGRAYAAQLGAGATAAVGHDNRPSSPELAAALCRGLNESGVDVKLVGTVPTPALYFATYELETDGGIQITGSHNPPEYNGIKMTLGGRSLYGEGIQRLRRRIEADGFATGAGRTEDVEILDRYVEEIASRAHVDPPIRFVLDCGNGAGSVVAARALRAAGAEVDPLFCESDGTFPNHHPDPTVDENVKDLIARVTSTGAAFGVGLDGDADRIGVVTEKGEIIRGDHLLLLFALDVLKEQPGAQVIFDVKCSKALPEMIEKAGGIPIMWKTGHSLIKEKMKEVGSPISGEMSGHICFADRYFGTDDAIYDAARLAELVARENRPLSEIAARIPAYPSTPELRVDCPEERKFDLVARAVEHYKRSHDVIDIDGARILFDGGWALIRASNTQPVIVVRVEADTPELLAEIHAQIAEYLEAEGVRLPAA
jgi:phosphomannomutase/phosphoglucomutase